MRVAVLGLTICGIVAAAFVGAPASYACSGTIDPVEESDLIVGGRITGWELIEEFTTWNPRSGKPMPTDDPNFYGFYQPIRLSMHVDEVFKGSAPTEIELIGANTYQLRDGKGYWVGSSGACGAFDEDPTGKKWLLGLKEDDFGRLRPSLPLVFRSAEELEARLGPAAIPAAGRGASNSAPSYTALTVGGVGLALIAASAVVLRRTVAP